MGRLRLGLRLGCRLGLRAPLQICRIALRVRLALAPVRPSAPLCPARERAPRCTGVPRRGPAPRWHPPPAVPHPLTEAQAQADTRNPHDQQHPPSPPGRPLRASLSRIVSRGASPCPPSSTATIPLPGPRPGLSAPVRSAQRRRRGFATWRSPGSSLRRNALPSKRPGPCGTAPLRPPLPAPCLRSPTTSAPTCPSSRTRASSLPKWTPRSWRGRGPGNP